MNYKTKKTNPEYDIAIISFFDILGFSKIVQRHKNPNKILEKLKIFKHRSKLDMNTSLAHGQQFINFSDTVVRTTKVLSRTNKSLPQGILFHEFLDLIFIQFSLIWEGIFIRGGVTVGEIHHDESHIFGRGLNKAYYLERDMAIYPRIVIDPDVFHLLEKVPLLKSHHHTLPMEKQNIRELVRRGSDGWWFLDYLRVMGEEVGNIHNYGKFLKLHKQTIVKNLSKFKTLNRDAVKYVWLSLYHNEVVSSLPKIMFNRIGLEKEYLLIHKKDFEMFYTF